MCFLTKKIDIRIFSLLVVSTLLAACAGDNERDTIKPVVEGKAQIELQLPSIQRLDAEPSEADIESQINDISLFVFDSATGNKEFAIRLDIPYTQSSTDVDMSRWVSDQIITIINTDILANLSNLRNIHVVANINAAKLAAIGNESDLKAVITDAITAEIANNLTNPLFVMHGAASSHSFITNSRASVSLVRNVAKLNMAINTQDFTFGGTKIILAPDNQNISLKVGNVADRSYLVKRANSPTTAIYIPYAPKTYTPMERTPSTSKTLAHTYVNENIRATFDAEENATYILLQVPFRIEGTADIKKENYYKIFINNENLYVINRNTIYDILLNISSLGGEDEASAPQITGTLNILPWNENTVVSDLTQTFLTIDKAVLTMGTTYVLPFATNVPDNAFTLSLNSPEEWLKTPVQDGNVIKLTALGAGYTVPRATSFVIKAGNLTKRITVNQVATPVKDGSIALAPRTIYLSEVTPTHNVALTVNPITSKWVQIAGNTSMATSDQTSGIGNKTLKWTRGNAYTNGYFKFVSEHSLAYDSVKICNLQLKAPPEVEIGGQAGSSDYGDIEALAGDANWGLVASDQVGAWITASKVGGKLRLVVEEGPDEQKRYGSVTICHVNDPNYKKVIKVTQLDHIKVVLPEFEFLLFRYDWTQATNGKDLDTATEFVKTGLPALDSKAVGWQLFGETGSMGGATRVISLAGKPVLIWGGDNQNQKAGESVYLDMKNMNESRHLLTGRYVEFHLYANWYSAKSTLPIQVRINAYRGGEMVYQSASRPEETQYNFSNSGGESNSVYQFTAPRVISSNTKSSAAARLYKSGYTYVGKVIFDMDKRDATVEIASGDDRPPLTRRTMVETRYLDDLPKPYYNESKDDYNIRLEEYNRNNK